MWCSNLNSLTALLTNELLFHREEMPGISIYSLKMEEFMDTSVYSRRQLYLGKRNYMPPCLPLMKHDLICLPHFNVLESLLQVASCERPIKILCSYGAESMFSFSRYSIFCQFSAAVLRESMVARGSSATPAEGM